MKRCVFFKLISNFVAKSYEMAGLYIHIPFVKAGASTALSTQLLNMSGWKNMLILSARKWN